MKSGFEIEAGMHEVGSQQGHIYDREFSAEDVGWMSTKGEM
jgi:hypothetical protein